MARLALLGGEKLLHYTPRSLPWPERTEAGAERLKEAYLSGDWSFNTKWEREFEAAFASYHGASYGVFMANGTVTLECALQALGVGEGDEVVVPALTWVATALAVNYRRATPVIVDCDPATLCMDPSAFSAAITQRTKAVIPVHAYASTADLDEILAIAAKHGIAVIEDCAHAHGGAWSGRGVGSWGAVGSFSFQQSKIISSGEGGICITSDEELARRIYMAKHIGYCRQGPAARSAGAAPRGYICRNYRATAFQAVLLLEQLRGLRERLLRYHENAQLIAAAVNAIPGARAQRPGRLADPQSYYTFNFFFDGPEFDEISCETIQAALGAEGAVLNPSIHGPIYLHPLFNLDAADYRVANGRCERSERVSVRTLGWPHPQLYYRDAAEQFAAVLTKVLSEKDELRRYQRETALVGSGSPTVGR